MRSVYGAIFVGFAVVGFAGVFNARSPARAATASAAAADPERSTVQPATNPSPIVVRTELVQADVIRPAAAPPVVSRAVRPAVRRTIAQPSRSRFARVLFGDGQFRPQPFPTPAKHPE
jgi:hypothetical protein